MKQYNEFKNLVETSSLLLERDEPVNNILSPKMRSLAQEYKITINEPDNNQRFTATALDGNIKISITRAVNGRTIPRTELRLKVLIGYHATAKELPTLAALIALGQLAMTEAQKYPWKL